MQKIYNIDKWRELAGENGLHFINPRPRLVRVEVNAPTRSALSLIDHMGEVHFLALVEGRDTIEFHSLGEFSLVSDNPGVMIYTADGDDISSVVIAPVIFTKVMERRRRNPELQAFAMMMHQTMEASLARQAKEFERRIQTSARAASQVAQAPAGAFAPPADAQSPASGADGGPLPLFGGDSGGGGSGTEVGS